MKTLFLLRHAKSSWRDAGLTDFDRPLNNRGVRSAELIGTLLARRHRHPNLILSSPAVRARETAEIVIERAGFAAAVRYVDRLYLASVATLLETILQIEDGQTTVMLVGHNPGMEELLFFLTGAMNGMTTAALAMIRFEIDHWNEIEEGSGQLEWFINPKGLLTR